jgi:hypothetical protein
LLGGAELGGGRPASTRAGRRARATADLFEQRAELQQAEPHAAVRFVDGDA